MPPQNADFHIDYDLCRLPAATEMRSLKSKDNRLNFPVIQWCCDDDENDNAISSKHLSDDSFPRSYSYSSLLSPLVNGCSISDENHSSSRSPTSCHGLTRSMSRKDCLFSLSCDASVESSSAVETSSTNPSGICDANQIDECDELDSLWGQYVSTEEKIAVLCKNRNDQVKSTRNRRRVNASCPYGFGHSR